MEILVIEVSAPNVLLDTSSTWGAATAPPALLATSCVLPLQMAYAQHQPVSTSRYRGQRPINSPCWRARTPSAQQRGQAMILRPTSGSRAAGRARLHQKHLTVRWPRRGARRVVAATRSPVCSAAGASRVRWTGARTATQTACARRAPAQSRGPIRAAPSASFAISAGARGAARRASAASAATGTGWRARRAFPLVLTSVQAPLQAYLLLLW